MVRGSFIPHPLRGLKEKRRSDTTLLSLSHVSREKRIQRERGRVDDGPGSGMGEEWRTEDKETGKRSKDRTYRNHPHRHLPLTDDVLPLWVWFKREGSVTLDDKTQTLVGRIFWEVTEGQRKSCFRLYEGSWMFQDTQDGWGEGSFTRNPKTWKSWGRRDSRKTKELTT